MATFLEVELTVTLASPTPDGGYREAEPKPFVYYFAVSDAWARLPDSALRLRALAVAERVYADRNAAFRIAEPNDPAWLMLKDARVRRLSADEAASWPWVSAHVPAWEPSVCVVAHADGAYDKVNALEFGSVVPAEPPRVALDALLPRMLAGTLPACSAAYARALAERRDPRPLDEGARTVWGLAVFLVCALDRFASGGDVAEPGRALDRALGWLVEDGRATRETADGARQIAKRLAERDAGDAALPFAERVLRRAWALRYSDLDPKTPTAFADFVRCAAAARASLDDATLEEPPRGGGSPPAGRAV